MQNSSKVKKIVSRLLATTCLTIAASATAFASSFVAYNGPFGTSFATAVNVGLDSPVTGAVHTPGNPGDWFEFEGVPAGATLSSLFTVQDVSGAPLVLSIYDDAHTLIYTQGLGSPNFAALAGNVPLDGNLVFNIAPTNEAASNFAVTNSVPEPATLGAIGLGLVGIAGLGLRRRNKKN